MLTAEHKFNCCIAGLRKTKKMSMTMLVLVALVRTSSNGENIKAVKKMILDNRRNAIRAVAEAVGTSFNFGSCQAIFTDVLGMKNAATKFVPHCKINLSKYNVVWTSLKRC